jgi:hypothetical protein
MKKIFLLIALTITIFSCKNSETKEAEGTSEVHTFRAEFLYIEDAAVLKGDNFIYGVTIDDKMQELANKVQPIKKDDFDMVPVIVSGILSKKPEGSEGWDEIVTIKEILHVSDKPTKADIKIEENKS